MAPLSFSETAKRTLWNLATGLCLLLAGLLLASSWFQPPPQTQLDLFQTNLALQAARTVDSPEYQPLAGLLLGTDTVKAATVRYQEATSQWQQRLDQADQPVAQVERDALVLRTGILLVYQDQVSAAQVLWQEVTSDSLKPVAKVLKGLWGNPVLLFPNAEETITTSLNGWFQSIAMQRLLSLQQRVDALTALDQQQEQLAFKALGQLIIAVGIPLAGSLLGIVVAIIWVSWLIWRHQPPLGRVWQVPWPAATVQQVLTIWFLSFLLVGQSVPVIYARWLGVTASEWNDWQQAIGLALTYNVGAVIGLILIYNLTRRYYPLARDLLRVRLFDNWPLWGLGGYVVALPLVVIAGVISQLLLPNSGGGNPILSLILNSQDWGPRLLFLFVVAVCAPVFEEMLFRGVVLTSLTRDRPVWQAVLLSGVLFAMAHLNIADLLPLTTLGIVLGVVYSHSRNLLAPILLHACWNAGSFVALLVLGGQ